MEKLYTTDEVADMLRVTRRTLYNYIKAGNIKTIKKGKYQLIKESELKKYLEEE